jgi:4-alpha-glucanotransferase
VAVFPSTPWQHDPWHQAVSAALKTLGVDRLALAIHDASFPCEREEDLGRGSPYSRGAGRFVRAMRTLGFDALQLGPQGETSAYDPSPYDGTVMARNRASIAYGELLADPLFGALVDPDLVARHRLSSAQQMADHDASHAAQESLHEAAHARLLALRQAGEAQDVDGPLQAFRQRHASWLDRIALYEPLCRHHGHGDPRCWPDALDRQLWAPPAGQEADARTRRQQLERRHADALERFALGQMLVHAQHDAFRRRCQSLGLALQADLQIGLGPADRWCHQEAFLPGYLMGAPPSRTNPEGQPWGYPVLAPAESSRGAAAHGFVRARLAKIFREFDAVRIDHPHGWVCPWVYRSDDPDALHAVQNGARLYSSPFLPDHPPLGEHAIVRPEQLDRSRARYADRWVRALEPKQIERYARYFDAIVAAAQEEGQKPTDLICEVLSTLPHPLAAVLERHGLGRFRVTQKAKLDDPADVYRSENAAPEDWIMVGTHDTATIWAVAARWEQEGQLEAQAAYLTERLAPRGAAADASCVVERSASAVAQAKLAELFVADARRVMIFFADLFGQHQRYNLPGTVGPHNWSLRVPPDWPRSYPERAGRGEALHLPRALATALRARGEDDLAARVAVLPATPEVTPWRD